MKKLAGLEAKVSDRAQLRKSFLFAVLTSVLITVVGCKSKVDVLLPPEPSLTFVRGQ